jgi:hypothetical protein
MGRFYHDVWTPLTEKRRGKYINVEVKGGDSIQQKTQGMVQIRFPIRKEEIKWLKLDGYYLLL